MQLNKETETANGLCALKSNKIMLHGKKINHCLNGSLYYGHLFRIGVYLGLRRNVHNK